VSKLQVLALIFAFWCPASLFADQIVLKNGDRLSGSIEKSDDKVLVIKTEFAGEVTVPWPAVQEINSTQPLYVSLSDGKTVIGTVTTSDGNLAIVTASAGTVNEPSVFGGGLGLHVIQNNRTTLDLLGGINYTREKYSLLRLERNSVTNWG
jgi:small nuclear ribonucleoprotein (snRNP)-like protein